MDRERAKRNHEAILWPIVMITDTIGDRLEKCSRLMNTTSDFQSFDGHWFSNCPAGPYYRSQDHEYLWGVWSWRIILLTKTRGREMRDAGERSKVPNIRVRMSYAFCLDYRMEGTCSSIQLAELLSQIWITLGSSKRAFWWLYLWKIRVERVGCVLTNIVVQFLPTFLGDWRVSVPAIGAINWPYLLTWHV